MFCLRQVMARGAARQPQPRALVPAARCFRMNHASQFEDVNQSYLRKEKAKAEEERERTKGYEVPKWKSFYDDEHTQEHQSRPYHLRKPLRVKAEGKNILLNPLFNKGTAFSVGERDRLGLRGLLPSKTVTFQDQIDRVMDQINREDTDVRKYQVLRDLHDRNETLYHRVILDNVEQLAPIIYTPTVGEACLEFGHDYRRARGMYFSSEDHGHMAAMCYNWPGGDIHVIVVTDGSRILGLGDLGANGMAIPVGKLALYCAAGGLAPHRVLPVMFDMGTDNESLWKDRHYLGMHHRRMRGRSYFEFLDEFMYAARSRWPNVMIQFEDFSSDKAMTILNRYRKNHLCFNDDIQGTGAVAVAGIYSAIRQKGVEPKQIVNERIVIAGAGSAGLGVANALAEAMVHEGVSPEEARSKFWVVDMDGVLAVGGKKNPTEHQIRFSRDDNTGGMSLSEVIQAVKPTILLGLTGCGGLFTENIVREMAVNNDRPIIFPLSNPTRNAECTAEEVYNLTEGRGIFASGSPFDPFEFNGSMTFPSQCNNMFIFPGIGLGATVANCKVISDLMIHAASIALANSLTDDEVAEGRVFPDVKRIRDISHSVAIAVIMQAHNEGLIQNERISSIIANRTRADLEQYIARKMYDPIYVPLVDQIYNRDMT